MQCRGQSQERPVSGRAITPCASRLPSAVGRSSAEVSLTSVGQSVASEEKASRVSSASLSIPATRPVRPRRYDTVLSFTELQIIERAKFDRKMRQIAYNTSTSTQEVDVHLRVRHFRPEAFVQCWWPEDLLTSTGVNLLLSDQKRHQAALYRQLKIDRWRTLVQRKEMELNDRYCLPMSLAGPALTDRCYLTKRCQSASPRVFCPSLSPTPNLCMRFLRRHSVRTQKRFVDDVARKRAEGYSASARECNRSNTVGSHYARDCSLAGGRRTARSAPVCCGF